jgi:hypothetical protein
VFQAAAGGEPSYDTLLTCSTRNPSSNCELNLGRTFLPLCQLCVFFRRIFTPVCGIVDPNHWSHLNGTVKPDRPWNQCYAAKQSVSGICTAAISFASSSVSATLYSVSLSPMVGSS